MAEVKREMTMAVSQKALFQAITDFERYPDFVDEVVSVSILESKESFRKVKFELEVIKRFDYVLEFTLQGQDRVEWRLVSSNFFKKNEGRWILKSVDTGHTHVDYALDIGFGFLVPGWVSKKLTETNLPKMLKGFETRAMKIQELGQS